MTMSIDSFSGVDCQAGSIRLVPRDPQLTISLAIILVWVVAIAGGRLRAGRPDRAERARTVCSRQVSSTCLGPISLGAMSSARVHVWRAGIGAGRHRWSW